jgi:hypothetical protein
MIDFIVKHPGFVGFFRTTEGPDESFFLTIIMNSPLAKKMVNLLLDYVDWSARETHPKTLGMENFEQLKNSNKFFARKFDVDHDAVILDPIDSKDSRTDLI